jgi:two-component system, LytTR family, sensor kinase
MLQVKKAMPLYTPFLLKRLKIMAGAVVISLFFSLVLVDKVFHEGLFSMFLITYIQLEIFLWIGEKFFNSVKVSTTHFKQKIILRLLGFYALVLLVATFFFLAVFYVQYLNNNYGFENFISALKHLELRSFIAATFVGFAIGTLFFFYVQWSDALKREQKLAQEKLIFQYETLKTQVNPHFLFNSLNTLSSLVRSDPVLSEEYIQKFAAIYRYILENQERDLVPLSHELQFVRDYFSLQKIRDEEKIELLIELTDADKMEVLPVSLQLLVENALKHNSATRTNPLEIIIHQEGIDKLVARNNFQSKTQISRSSKTGLKNLNERCRLILNREIEVIQTESEYVVKIPAKINLK